MRISLLALAFWVALWSNPATAAEEQPEAQSETTLQQVVLEQPAAQAGKVQEAPVPDPKPQIISQADPRVSDLRLGRRTVKQSGCLAIAACFASQLIGHDREPQECLQMLISNDMFTSAGAMYWAAEILLGVRMTQLYRSGTEALEETLRQLKSGAQVLLEIVYRDTRGRTRTHWVIANRVVDEVLYVFDSNGGLERSFQQVHGGAKNVRRVVSVMNR